MSLELDSMATVKSSLLEKDVHTERIRSYQSPDTVNDISTDVEEICDDDTFHSNLTCVDRLKNSLKEYVASPQLLLELVVVIIFWNFCIMLPQILGLQVHERPIPYQVLNNSGDVVLEFDLNHDYVYPENQTIPVGLLFSSCFYIPLTLLPLFGIFAGRRYDAHAIVCVFLMSSALSDIISALIKLYVGRLRPNFYNMCEFNTESLQCEGDDEYNTEARKSFPSGHSTMAFSAYTVIILFLLGKAQTVKKPYKKKVLSIFAAFPITYAFFVAASRVRDNWHHPSDVIAGSCIGFLCAFFSYSLW